MKICLVIVCLLLLAGCWDRQELTEIGIVAGMAIDKDPDTGEFMLTSQYLRPAAESTQTPSPDRPYLMVTTTGKTIYEVMRNANQTIERQGFFEHNKVIIISEEVARDGLLPVVDAFQRGKEVRGYVWIVIAKGAEAKKVIATKGNNISRIPANYLVRLIDNAEHTTVGINVLNYYKQTLGDGVDPVIGVLIYEEIKTEPFESVRLSGGAVFKEDKLVGFINEVETRGYNWVRGEGPVFRGALSLPSLFEKDKFITILLKEVTSQIKSEVNGEEISFTIKVEQEARITEQQATGELKTRKALIEYLKQVEEQTKKVIEQDIKLVIDKAQSEFKSDVFGFGQVLNRDHPTVWNKVKDDWAGTFSNVPYTVDVTVNITSTGLMKGPFQPKQ
ncbi:Ger(x)C family spore germination protein [Bacillus solitudinis]|uniref:Ger(x)C family spore germination protein n=1 Tax=Bacillus solitudinis TaxID=2014074 RepID=UPI000C246AA2|nr:Ger(x)C family spore germination protein [Bacillus solitudinis]